MSRNLDEIDLKILTEIQADGRITNVELAKRVGISPPPCLRRVRALEEEGYIHGYRGLLDARKLGFDVTVFAAVHLSSQAEADLRAFEEFRSADPVRRRKRVSHSDPGDSRVRSAMDGWCQTRSVHMCRELRSCSCLGHLSDRSRWQRTRRIWGADRIKPASVISL